MPQIAILAVRYDIDRSRVSCVQTRAIDEGPMGEPVQMTRAELLITAKLGAEFVRLTEGRAGSLRAVPVQFVRLGREVYIRCDANPWPLDDLMGIPEY